MMPLQLMFWSCNFAHSSKLRAESVVQDVVSKAKRDYVILR